MLHKIGPCRHYQREGSKGKELRGRKEMIVQQGVSV